ncbi:DUF4139 domain-containing protein [Thermodesulfobacteriota bacterium]
MKKSFGIAAIFILVISVSSSYAAIPSQIKEVTLFSNQAQIKREALGKAIKGLNEFHIEVQAFRLDSDSISAKVFGDGEIYSVQFKEVPLAQSPQSEIKALEKKIKEMNHSISSMQNELETLGKKESFIDSLLEFSKTQVPQDIKTQFPETEDLVKTLSFLTNAYEDIRVIKEPLLIDMDDRKDQLLLLKKELSSLKGTQAKKKRVIEILFNSAKDQEVAVEASYITYNSYWNPLYKADVPLDLKDVSLTMFSKIRQKSGETWEDIQLSVSNVIPLRGAALPSPGSWVLDIRNNEVPVAGLSRSLHSADSAAPQTTAPKMPEQKAEADFVTAERKELPLSFEYQLPQKITIESRDKDTVLPLFSKNLTGQFFHMAAPRTNPLTFLVCRTSADKELLGGLLNVHFGGRFVGKTYLAEKKAGQDFDLNLGADREVKVRREKIKDKVKETYFGKIERDTIVREIEYKITIENLKQAPVLINVVDSIPVSRTDRIVVKDLEIIPQPKEKNHQHKEGVMLWEFNLEPSQKREIEIRFIVTYPKDEPVTGL